jgi:hypothetical protein
MDNVTIILPVSRPDYLDRIFHALEILRCNREQTNLLTYVDGDWRLFETVRNKTQESKFNQRLSVHRGRGPANVSSITRRRQRIADIHNEMRGLLENSKYIFSLEDDTLFPTYTLEQLLRHYAQYPFAGFISGVQLGRWGYPHIGAWRTNDIYEPTVLESTPMGNGLEQVDAAGFYCFLTKTENYKGHEFAPFEDVLGPDVTFGLSLRRAGLLNYADFGLQTMHLTKDGDISLGNTKPIQVRFTKTATMNRAHKWMLETL